MGTETFRRQCLSFPHVTEEVQWGDNLVFKVGGKLFAITSLEPGGHFASLKCSPERFHELVERPGMMPAPYLARAYWIALEREDAAGHAELLELLREAYEIVLAGLPKKVREGLGTANANQPKRSRKRTAQ